MLERLTVLELKLLKKSSQSVRGSILLGDLVKHGRNCLERYVTADAKQFVSPMRTCALATGALSWPGCLSLSALMSSLRHSAAEDETLPGGRRQMCGCHS